jgi:RimJ/RimL family protein N-acetyltransferase
MNTVLQTARMTVRHLVPDEAEALQRITGSPEVMRYFGDCRPYSIEKTRQTIAQAIDHYRTRGFGEYAFVDRRSGTLVGFGGHVILPERTCVEIEYVFDKPCWGRGLATEVARELVRHGFERLGFDVLGTSFDPANHASMRVAAKLGFRYERSGVDEYGLPTIYYVMARPGG